MNDFTNLSQWQAFSSGLVQVQLVQEPAALVLHYDFGGAGGFVVARRELALQMPQRFRLCVRMRGEGLPNRLELKLVDPSGNNVWWYRKSGVVWTEEWEEWFIESHQFEFAWGPAGGGLPGSIAAVEFAFVAEAGGAGRVWLADLQIEDLSARESCTFSASNTQVGFTTDLQQGEWRSTQLPAWLQLDLLESRAFAALHISWSDQATAFRIEISNDGRQWHNVLEVNEAGGRHSDIYVGPQYSRYVRLHFLKAVGTESVGIKSVEVVSVERAKSLIDFLHAVAEREPCGTFPKYLRRQQSYWTVFGAPTCPAQGLINEEGMVEVQRAGFSLEPFIHCAGRWLTWADAQHSPSLVGGYLPIPSVTADYSDMRLAVTATATLLNNTWCAWLSYTLVNLSSAPLKGELILAARPFQVVPPWQSYREFGGMHPLRQIDWRQGALCVAGHHWVIPQGPAQGNLRGWLQQGLLHDDPSRSDAHNVRTTLQDGLGLAQGEIGWSFKLDAGTSRHYCVAIPFGEITETQATGIANAMMQVTSESIVTAAIHAWREQLAYPALQVPVLLQVAAAISKSSVAHILINRDGAAIQPGPRRYARSWIRDGATMCAALLRTGHYNAVRDFLVWYAPFVQENGFVPCCVDREGVDMLVEHDSHGQWMHVVAEYFLFSGDTEVTSALLPSVIRAGQYLIALRANRLTAIYDTPELHTRRGLIPESVSHEGYLAQPVHSYWDSFWAIRGLADASALFKTFKKSKTFKQSKMFNENQVLQNTDWEVRFAQEEKALRADVTASIARVIAERGISHIPGSVEWADADPTASACAVGQLGESECFPAEALRYTFDGFMSHWRTRMADIATRTKYSAYDIRVINALIKLGRREDAWEIARFYLHDRRPQAWNQWPEITWPDPQSPGHLGDLPHSWIGAEYVLAFRCMFVDEYHERLIIGQGLLLDWLAAPGITLDAWPTAWGKLSYELKVVGPHSITLNLHGSVAPPDGLEIQLPLASDIERIEIDDAANLLSQTARTARVQHSPAQIVFHLKS